MMRPYRQEWKYVVHHSVRHLLLARWMRYLERAPYTNRYAVSPILSQYYDSPTLQFYHEKHDGVAHRSKVRLRTYGYRREPGVAAFLEIKHRAYDRIRKVRQPIRDFDPDHHLEPANWRFDDVASRDAFLLLLERHRLRPSAQVFYLREAYQGAVESDLRVTWDSCLKALYPGEVVTPDLLADRCRSVMPDTLVILEVKATHGIPPWVHAGIVAAELQQKTVPKYISAVELLGMQEHSGTGVYA